MSDANLKIRHAKRQNAQNLDLSNMELETIPPDFYILKNLLNVNLSNNKLSEIDKSIENMKNLTELNLENNNISILPLEITNLPNLAKLKLSNNPIYTNLKDYQYNWKASVREFLQRGDQNLNKSTNINTSVNELNVSSNLSSGGSKKAPFNFNMNNAKLNNTATTFFKKKESEVISEIPKCNLFDHSLSGSNSTLSYNNVFHRKLSNNINYESSTNNINSNNAPVKLSSNFNKKLTLNKLIKKETFHQNQDEFDINNSNKHNPNDTKLIEELQNKISNLEDELNKLKFTNIKKEEEYNTKIKALEFEVKTSKINNVESKRSDTAITNKRNWMENTNIASSFNMNTPENENRIKELETQLQKETQNNKRLKNEIDRLNQILNSNKNNVSSNEMLKSNDINKNIIGVHEIRYEDIELFDKIGQGGFSVIHRGIWNYIPVAIKIIFDPNVTEDLLNEFSNEIKMLCLLRHPNIILLLGICSKPQKLAIITEYVENGSLFELLHRSGKEINFQTKIKLIAQLIRVYAYIHKNGIIHRDIKSHNVLIDENLNVKLCDFGLAKYKTELSWTQFSGTPSYMAPELYMKKAYDEKIDVFAFGTMMWEILVRKIPYEGYEVSEIKAKVIAEEKLFLPKTISQELGNIINNCRLLDPTKRPSFSELANINLNDLLK